MLQAARTSLLVCLAFFGVSACAPVTAPDPIKLSADDFVAKLNDEIDARGRAASAAYWVRATYINEDTQILAADASEKWLEFHTRAVKEASVYDGEPMSDEAARALKLLKLGSSAPAPDDATKRARLAEISTRMPGIYGQGKYCPEDGGPCQDLEALSAVLAKSRDYDVLLDAWTGWRTISPPMRDDYAEFVALSNEGARELGFENLGELWRSGYDMSPAAFADETHRLWNQVKPLYDELHCAVRVRLNDEYGDARVPLDGPIPAHLLGNMWAQEWSHLYPLMEPFEGVSDLDVTGALAAQGYTAERMTRTAEDFFVSLGMPALPDPFWSNSMLTKPRDREVVCHASAWSVDAPEDVRIKMCITPTQEDLVTIYHELGHIYYYLAYADVPSIFQEGAHDGFHEGIGDTVTLSMTPSFLESLGLVSDVSTSEEAVINNQMKVALDKIAFLPFGKLIDEWRWKVFSGEIAPEDYNAGWWALRTEYQGIAPPVARSEANFDPGAKYHVPGNTPYTRYFLAFILQFQFQRALCEIAGHDGPLHTCSLYGNKAAGEALWSMMQKGASQPWQDTLEDLTGSREMDASAIVEYFAPLMAWLEEDNRGRSCGV
ncbi:MAG: M2 family metallopeptidase [Gammaproteobacteria bacterium]|nr:M2 family metallopeptidase [Gammaproteobacteria bacterium]